MGGGDTVHYAVDVAGASSPLQVDVELFFQPIAYRWAQNLKSYESEETRRFVSFYESMAHVSSVVLATAAALVSANAN